MISIILLFALCGCGADAAQTSVAATLSTATIKTSDSTEESIPSPTEEREKINIEITNFLNKEGDFSDENIHQYLINYHGNINLELGFIESSNGAIDLQGWLFDYARVGDFLVMAVGFNGIDGKNHVKQVAIPISVYENPGNEIPFTFEKLGAWKVAGTSHDLIYETDSEMIIAILDLLKGHPVKFGFPNPNNESSGADKERLIDLFGEDNWTFFENIKEKTIELVSEVNLNESIRTEVNKVTYSSNADFEIPDIDSIDDLQKIDLSKLPCLCLIGSNLIP